MKDVKTFVLATRNLGKAREISAMLDLPGVTMMTLRDFPPMAEVEEDGATFEENALKKARAVARHCGIPALADDSGLEVEALDGLPGIRSARFAGDDASDDDNNRLLLERMKTVPAENRTGRFVCVLALVGADGGELLVRGECRGTILDGPRGSGGFGYDPLFYYPPLNKSFAEMTAEEKSRVSHRGEALRKLHAVLTGEPYGA